MIPWTPKVYKIMAFWALFRCVLAVVLHTLGSRTELQQSMLWIVRLVVPKGL